MREWFRGRSEEADGPGRVEQLARASHGSVVVQAGGDVHVGDVNLRTGVPVRTRYRHQVEKIAPLELVGRETELAALADFACSAEAEGRYQWLRAGVWSGKTALLSWFALHPPERVRVVSFFITARLPGQADRTAFVDAVLEQLLTVLGEAPPPYLTAATRESHLMGLLVEAAEACRDRDETLLLVVDGLDEDRGYTVDHEAHSIAALLPDAPPEGMRVMVAGRPDPPLPGDVDERHPLRDPAIVRSLEVSPHAQALRREMERDLKRLLAGSGLEQDLLGLLTASGGGLSAGDLAELTGTGRWQVRDHLGTVAGRSFTRRPGVLAPDTEVYLLGHEELRTTAHDVLGPRLSGYRDRLHTWADQYRERSWPADTPEYLLRGYHTTLLDLGDLDRATALCTDLGRHDRLAAVTGGDSSGLGQITTTLDAHVATHPIDLATVARLAVHRDHLRDRNTHIPTAVPALWAYLGHHHRARALADSIADLDRRGAALAAIAAELMDDGGDDQAADLFTEAIETVGSISGNPWNSEATVRTFTVTAFRHRTTELRGRLTRLTRSIPDPERRDAALKIVAEVATEHGEHDEAIAAAQAIIDPEHRCGVLTAIVGALVADNRHDHAAQLITQALSTSESINEHGRRSTALAGIATVMAAMGHHDQAGDLFTQAIEIAESVPDGRRYNALTIIALALVEAGQHERAEELFGQVIHSVNYPTGQRGYSRSIVVALVRAGLPDRAVRTADSITVPGERDQAHMAIAEELAVLGDHEAAAEVAGSVADPGWRSEALTAIVVALIDDGEFDRAVELAGSITAPRQQDKVQSRIVEELAESGEYECATDTADSINDPGWRSMALATIADVLVDDGEDHRAVDLLDRAAEAARSSVDLDGHGKAMAAMVKALAVTGHDVQAVETAHSITVPRWRNESLVWTVLALARTGRHERAVELAGTITDPKKQGETLAAIARALIEAGDRARALDLLEQASRVTVHLTAPDDRGDVLVSLARALAEAGRDSHAADLLRQAAEAAQAAINVLEQHRLFETVVRTLADIGHHDQAVGVARSIPGVRNQDNALLLVVEVMAATDRVDEANEVARRIGNSKTAGWATAAIVLALAKSGCHDRAVELASSIADPSPRSTALAAVAEVLHDEDHHDQAADLLDQALRTAHQITDHYQRGRALIMIAETLAQTGRHDWAVEAARALEAPYQASQALAAVVRVLTETGHLHRALDVAETITDSYHRNEALAVVVEALAVTGDHDRALAVGRTITDDSQQSTALSVVARIAATTGDADHALQAGVAAIQAGHWHTDPGALCRIAVPAALTLIEESAKLLGQTR